ncbi:cation:proton antiporter [Actinosynnema sp. CA-248983]
MTTGPPRTPAVPPAPSAGRVGTVVGALAAVVLGTALVLLGGGAPHGVDPAARLLLAVAVVLATCHLCGALLTRLGQPAVLGEVLGGILLGPSVLGALAPAAAAWLLPREVTAPLGVAAQLGLVTFMFLVGYGLRDELPRTGLRTVGVVTAGSVALPFAAGVAIAVPLAPHLAGADARPGGYPVFLGVALSITAVPVLARILTDLGLERSRVGAVALACAATGDGLAWAALTLVLAAATPASVWVTVGAGFSFLVFLRYAARPLLARYARRAEHSHTARRLLLPLLVVCASAAAGVTQSIGLHPVIGAFLLGTAVPRTPLVDTARDQLQGFTVTVLLPLFFVGTGLATSIGLLGGSPTLWLVFAAVLVVACTAKFAGAGVAARLSGFTTGESMALGSLMNCRGVTELVIAGVGLEAGLINQTGFTVLVLVALLTTVITTPVTRRALPGELKAW